MSIPSISNFLSTGFRKISKNDKKAKKNSVEKTITIIFIHSFGENKGEMICI